MSLSLKQSHEIQAVANLLYSFLPGAGSARWKGHVTFESVSNKLGVGRYWPAVGSKGPKIAALLEGVLQHQPQQFERLIVEIVRAGLVYRRKDAPVKPEEIDRLNGHLLSLGFKFPELHDPSFRASIAVSDDERARTKLADAARDAEARISNRQARSLRLGELKKLLEELTVQADRQGAGRSLQSLLNQLFDLFGLKPREPFRVVGEEIDGSFELDSEVYLLEAKWENAPLNQQPLLVFREKVESKSAFTRGVFLAMNGITSEAKDAITRGKQPLFFLVNGHDLMSILMGHVELDEFFRRRQRLLAEEGAVEAHMDRVVHR